MKGVRGCLRGPQKKGMLVRRMIRGMEDRREGRHKIERRRGRERGSIVGNKYVPVSTGREHCHR